VSHFDVKKCVETFAIFRDFMDHYIAQMKGEENPSSSFYKEKGGNCSRQDDCCVHERNHEIMH